jgi:hypothetical protein
MPSPQAVLITQPSVNFHDFLLACQQALDYSVVEAADASRRLLSEPQKFLCCLDAFRDRDARVGPELNLTFISHLSFSVLVVADERDMRDTLECCSGMSFVTADTVDRRVLIAVITGTLAQWRDAVAAGFKREAAPSVRAGFHKIHNLFLVLNLDVWCDYNVRQAGDGTLFMEHKRHYQ